MTYSECEKLFYSEVWKRSTKANAAFSDAGHSLHTEEIFNLKPEDAIWAWVKYEENKNNAKILADKLTQIANYVSGMARRAHDKKMTQFYWAYLMWSDDLYKWAQIFNNKAL